MSVYACVNKIVTLYICPFYFMFIVRRQIHPDFNLSWCSICRRIPDLFVSIFDFDVLHFDLSFPTKSI